MTLHKDAVGIVIFLRIRGSCFLVLGQHILRVLRKLDTVLIRSFIYLSFISGGELASISFRSP